MKYNYLPSHNYLPNYVRHDCLLFRFVAKNEYTVPTILTRVVCENAEDVWYCDTEFDNRIVTFIKRVP